VYPIDLQTILQVFANQSGELRTTVRQVANVKGECQALVVLSLGKVVSCTIQQGGRPVLVGEDAFRMLVRAGILQWEYTPTSPSASLPSNREQSPVPTRPAETSPALPPRQYDAPGMPAGTIPVQARPIPAGEFATWPRLHRFVYQLSTGDKTAEDIARILSAPPERVRTALLSLVNLRAIYLR
jgi:hypothetical protein